MLPNNKGAALVTSLVMLMALTVISIAAMSSSTVQLQVVGNDESNLDAFERAQSVVDAVIDQSGPFVAQGTSGYTTCYNITGCSNSTPIAFSNSFFSGTEVQAKVTLVSTNSANLRTANASSASGTMSILYTVTGYYDDTGAGQGKAEVTQGYVLQIPKSEQDG